MTDFARTPTCASDLASLAAEVTNQLLALAKSISRLHGVPGCDDTVKHLAALAELHALQWVEHFEEEEKLHRAAEKPKQGEA